MVIVRRSSSTSKWAHDRADEAVKAQHAEGQPPLAGERQKQRLMVIRSENPSLARRTQPSSARALAVAGAPGPSLAASVRSSAGPTRFYDSDAVPMVSASLTGRTDQGVFIGASAGSLAAIARLSGGDEGFASGSVLVRPGFVSHGRLLPSASTPEPLSDSL